MGAQKGSTMLAVLVVFLVISLLLLSMLQLANVDRKMSRNYTTLLQSRQAVDGGVVWACEQTYNRLQATAGSGPLPDLPVSALAGNQTISGPPNQTTCRILGEGVKLLVQGNNYCIYGFTCEGCCHGVFQTATVRVRYDFLNLYDYSVKPPLFDRRIFTDHGRIVSYQQVNNEGP
ncbi:MAG: hypothetical protein ACM3PE_01440 [Deltaproteobacteria bacterium]